jgi:putative ABC transport system permease protein
VADIVTLLSTDIVRLVVAAASIATPLAWLLLNKWLESFAYRITISIWIFLAAGIVALLIALLTISYQAVRAALANPVKTLRSE